MTGVLNAVHLHVRSGDLVAEPDTRGVVVAYEIEIDPDGSTTARWDVTTNLWVGPTPRQALEQTGRIPHGLSHTLLSDSGVVLDLRPPVDEPDPDREHDERATGGA